MVGESWWQAARLKAVMPKTVNYRLTCPMFVFFCVEILISSICTLYTYDVSLKQTYMMFIFLYIYTCMHLNVEHTSPIPKKKGTALEPSSHDVLSDSLDFLWSRTSKHLEHQGKLILKDKDVTCIESPQTIWSSVLFFVQLLNLGNVISWTCWSNLKHSMFEAKDLQQLVPWSKGEGRNHGWLPGYISA